MPPTTYRYYDIDGAGHFHDPEWFEAANDEDATARVKAMHPDAKLEIWRGARLIAKLPSAAFDPDDPRVQNEVAERLLALALRMRREQTEH